MQIGIDDDTETVGKISSISQAKRMCKAKSKPLPCPGHSRVVDEGLVGITDTQQPGTVWCKTLRYRYRTYLDNEEGVFRMHTWISSSPWYGECNHENRN